MNKNKPSWLESHISLPSYNDPISEKENSISHLIASLISYGFLLFVLVQKSSFSTLPTYWGMVVFALSQSILFTSSTIYHKLEHGDAKRLFRILDHSTIYFLIVGTYTPIMLYINTFATQIILILLYVFLVIGIVTNILFWGKYKVLHVLIYLLMGWAIVLVWDQVVPNLPGDMLYFIITAGLLYTFGVIFYALKKVPHAHLIWHIFCLCASATFSIGFVIYFL
jgi:hemolysin III